ncbi:YbaL family putative K(+) efflux transporter [Lysobacter hankyongensis]|uniref:YbaL family putative K(+) efflux transporter n=1 Tax=Lysobacter hankyongensis TaxID=1176535 RepID=A0ABP9BHI7_9GAMM
MPHHTSLIAMLCIGFVLAFIFGLLAHRLRFSPIVGYLLAGVLVGPYTPGFVGDETLAPQLAEIGVILLMFGVGLHFSMRDLMDVRRIAVPGAIVQMAAATAMGWFLGTRLGWSDAESLIFGLSLSVASTVVLLRALETARLLDSERGRIAIGWLIVEDLAMVLALVLVPAFAANGGADTGGLGTALLTTLLKVGGFVALMLLVGRRVLPWLLERVAGTGSRELFTLFVLACAMGIAFGAAELFGVSFALGAFFAGMLLNESPFGHKAAEDSLPLRDAFAVLFFVSVGMLFDPMILVRHPLMVLETLGIIVIGKSLAAWAVVRMLGKSNDIALTIAASLAQIGEFSFILIGLGASLGLMSDESRDLILAGAILSILINPPLFALMTRRTRKPDTVQTTATRPPQGHVLLIGYGRVGVKLAEVLQRANVPFMVIDTDGDKVINARAAGYTAIRGNAADDDVLAEAMPGEAALAVLTIPDPLEAGKVAQRLKLGTTSIPVLARAHSDEAVKHLLQRGADAALLAEHALAHSLGEMITAMPQYRSGPLRSAN